MSSLIFTEPLGWIMEAARRVAGIDPIRLFGKVSFCYFYGLHIR